MKFIKDKKLLVMSLMDLEHCGFNHDDFCGELFLNGIDDPDAQTPDLIMVDFVGGAVVTDKTAEKSLEIMQESHKRFEEHVDRIIKSQLKGSNLIDRLSYKQALEQATRFMDAMEKQYQDNHPCPKCGSHNVHIEINGLGGGNVDGSEWCDDCGWKKETNTFSKEGE
jgi:ribosomal protein L37AE/L43A